MNRGLTAVLVGLAFSRPAGADQIFLREAEAPRSLFGDSVSSERKVLELSNTELSELSRLVGRRVDARKYPYLEVWSESKDAQDSRKLVGYIFLLDVVGQSQPISFAVAIKPDGTMQGIEVMVYREPQGEEIRERRFRAQFSGKKLQDPLVLGKDVDAISGATISSQSAAYAARKGLALAELLRKPAARQPP